MGGENQIVLWNGESEEPLTELNKLGKRATDWSRDGKELLVDREASDTHRSEIWLLSGAPTFDAKRAARKTISDPDYDLADAHFSPYGPWVGYRADTGFSTRLE